MPGEVAMSKHKGGTTVNGLPLEEYLKQQGVSLDDLQQLIATQTRGRKQHIRTAATYHKPQGPARGQQEMVQRIHYALQHNTKGITYKQLMQLTGIKKSMSRMSKLVSLVSTLPAADGMHVKKYRKEFAGEVWLALEADNSNTRPMRYPRTVDRKRPKLNTADISRAEVKRFVGMVFLRAGEMLLQDITNNGKQTD